MTRGGGDGGGGVDVARALRARSLAPLVKARGFGMTRADGVVAREWIR
jgi:hypothetical protein